ncbi:MAG: hypothetical protein FWG87_14455 [Defluviitaleaceae bacterium]|nr:hypothetical protein [Defluviitaleaceae bacterium]
MRMGRGFKGMERGFSRIWRISADSVCVNCVLCLYLVITKIYGLNADLTDLHRFSRILSGAFFYPRNPCKSVKSVFNCL